MGEKVRFFSVKRDVTIGGVLYRTSICYPLRGTVMERVVGELIERGMARGYPEEMRFITGVPCPVKPPAPVPASVGVTVAGQKLKVGSSSASRRKGGR